MEQKTEVGCCLEALLMLRLVDGLQLTGELTTATSVHEKGSSAGGKEMDIRGNCAPGYIFDFMWEGQNHTHPPGQKKGAQEKKESFSRLTILGDVELCTSMWDQLISSVCSHKNF